VLLVLHMGVTVVTRKPGDGVNRPKKGDRVEVHYTGTLSNGVQFDTSRTRAAPFEFNLGCGQVIRGWDEGIAQLSLGERATLTVTPDYGYGDRAVGPIPPHSTLIFDVELVSIGGPGSGQAVTLWNTAVGAFLIILATGAVAWGLHDTLTNHSFTDHFFS
jgi:FK506-binding protein 1